MFISQASSGLARTKAARSRGKIVVPRQWLGSQVSPGVAYVCVRVCLRVAMTAAEDYNAMVEKAQLQF